MKKPSKEIAKAETRDVDERKENECEQAHISKASLKSSVAAKASS